MNYYKIYGLNIQSQYKFEEVKSVKKSDCQMIDVVIMEKVLPKILTEETESDRKKGVGCVGSFQSQRSWIRVKEQGCFLIERGEKITYQLKQQNNPGIVSQILLGVVMAAILMQRGVLALHGSGVVFKDKAIILSGNSGAGKSTLASALLNTSGIFLADDTVAIKVKDDNVYAQPGYAQQKLCKDALEHLHQSQGKIVRLPALGKEKEKYGVRLEEGYCEQEQQLYAIFILEKTEDDTVQISEIQGSEKIKYLMKNIYKREIYLEAGMRKEVFRQWVTVANQVRIYRLTRPAEGMSTKLQTERIMEVLYGEGN